MFLPFGNCLDPEKKSFNVGLCVSLLHSFTFNFPSKNSSKKSTTKLKTSSPKRKKTILNWIKS